MTEEEEEDEELVVLATDDELEELELVEATLTDVVLMVPIEAAIAFAIDVAAAL